MKACKICGRKLSRYNKTKVCFFHNFKPYSSKRSIQPVCSSRPEVTLVEEYQGNILGKYDRMY